MVERMKGVSVLFQSSFLYPNREIETLRPLHQARGKIMDELHSCLHLPVHRLGVYQLSRKIAFGFLAHMESIGQVVPHHHPRIGDIVLEEEILISKEGGEHLERG